MPRTLVGRLGPNPTRSAERRDVGPDTLARWERGEREPTGALLGRVKRFLGDDEAGVSESRRALRGSGPWFSVEGAAEKISVLFGPKYIVAVVHAPPGRDFICFEPMSGPTNAFNLAHSRIYQELQSIQPGGTWRESFWIHPTGY